MADTTPSAPGPFIGSLAKGALANLGLAAFGIYAIGFLVANAYYGDLWVVDPSFLQTRYIAAGALWFLFASTNIVPCYYLLYFWDSLFRKERKPTDSAEQGDPAVSAMIAWAKRRGPILGFVLWVCIGLFLLVIILFGLALFVITPFLTMALLIALGAASRDLLFAVLAFHGTMLGLTIAFRSAHMDSLEAWAFERNPHRIALGICALLFHAIVFGKTIYPGVPSSSGGGRPIAVALSVLPGTTLPPHLLGEHELPDAWLVGISGDFIVALLPRPRTDTLTAAYSYCPIALSTDQVALTQVLVPDPHIPDYPLGSWLHKRHSRPQIGPCP